jgi:pimeloyl-ACP methyl ester carboxylesterase
MAGALGLGAGPTSPVVHALLSVPASRTAFASATLASPWAIRMSLRKFMERDELITDDLLERFTATTRLEGMSEATGRWAATALFADESASRSGQRSSYQQYQAPVLLVWGDRDVATPPQQAQELAALLPHCSLTMIPGANHFPHVEDQPRVVAALRPFLLAQQADVHTNPE